MSSSVSGGIVVMPETSFSTAHGRRRRRPRNVVRVRAPFRWRCFRVLRPRRADPQEFLGEHQAPPTVRLGGLLYEAQVLGSRAGRIPPAVRRADGAAGGPDLPLAAPGPGPDLHARAAGDEPGDVVVFDGDDGVDLGLARGVMAAAGGLDEEHRVAGAGHDVDAAEEVHAAACELVPVLDDDGRSAEAAEQREGAAGRRHGASFAACMSRKASIAASQPRQAAWWRRSAVSWDGSGLYDPEIVAVFEDDGDFVGVHGLHQPKQVLARVA